MKISTAALPFLILASALGCPALGSSDHGSWAPELGLAIHAPDDSTIQHSGTTGVHRPSDCCFSYTRRYIRCEFMKDYFVTSSGCSQPGVIFKNKWGNKVCANPDNEIVKDCMKKLDSAKKRGNRLVEEKE